MPKGVPSGYQFFRNVRLMGATGSGTVEWVFLWSWRNYLTSSSDTVAINNAASLGGRCDVDCGASSTLGAIIYFPVSHWLQNLQGGEGSWPWQPGEYLISAPIVLSLPSPFVRRPIDLSSFCRNIKILQVFYIYECSYLPGLGSWLWVLGCNIKTLNVFSVGSGGVVVQINITTREHISELILEF